MEQGFLAGFGRADITPEQYCGLAGFGNDGDRICNFIKDRIYATCVAISDETGSTVLLITVDLLQGKETTTVKLGREAITAATGIPGERIMIGGTHTHSGPSMYTMEDESQATYLRHLYRQLAKAAKDALEDQKPATLYFGSRQVENMTFVRHYLMNDGTYAGSNFGSFKSGIVRHLWPADEQLQMLRFHRENARDIVMVNWQSHGTFVGHPSEGILSADYIGAFRNHFEGLTGCHVGFYQGACGNLVPTSRIPELNRVGEKDYIGYGRLLAEEAAACMETLTQAEPGPVKRTQRIYQGEVDHSDDHLAEKARYVRRHGWELETWAERGKLATDNGFNSIFHAANVDDRSRLPKTLEMEIDAVRVGPVAFATAPYEMFCSNGQYVKEHSPFRQTFVLGYCNGSFSYLADENAYGYNCYEYNARRFSKGVSEDVACKLVEMLKELQ